MAAQDIKFGEWLGQGFDLFKENIGLLILVSLVSQLLSAATGGILAGPMMAGLALVTLKLSDKGEKPTVSTLFDGFNYFLQSFLFVLVWGAIMMGAYLLGLLSTCGLLMPLISVAALFLGTLLMFAPYLITDRKMAFWPASMASMEIVKPNLWPLLGYFLVASIIGGIGSVVCGAGVIVTMPITWCMVAVAYRALSGAGAPGQAPPLPQSPAASEASEDDAEKA